MHIYLGITAKLVWYFKVVAPWGNETCRMFKYPHPDLWFTLFFLYLNPSGCPVGSGCSFHSPFVALMLHLGNKDPTTLMLAIYSGFCKKMSNLFAFLLILFNLINFIYLFSLEGQSGQVQNLSSNELLPIS